MFDWDNPALESQVEDAINALFGDTSVSQATTHDRLADVIGELKSMQSSLDLDDEE